MKKIGKFLLIGALCAFFLVLGYFIWQDKKDVAFKDVLEENIFTLNGEETTFQELGFYVLYEEGEIEKQAMIYNPESTKDYWNLHIDGVFIQTRAKEVILQMAIHDALMYQLAEKNGVKLTAKQENALRNTSSDFYMDLLDEQKEHMPVDEEYVTEALRRIAIGEAYQEQLVKKDGCSEAGYEWEGANYEKLLKKQELTINEKLWDKILVGDISLRHDRPNFINGHNKKESD